MVFDKFALGKRGQLSVEFILIVLVVLILVEAIILPLRDYSENSVKDVLTVSYLEQDISKIQTAINSLSTYDEGKVTVNLHIPEDSNFFILKRNSQDLNILYGFVYGSSDMNFAKCKNNICSHEILLGDYEVTPKEITSGSTYGFGLYGPIDQKLIITKLASEIIISK
jgi:uncharacterized protein (UPF0333 family)